MAGLARGKAQRVWVVLGVRKAQYRAGSNQQSRDGLEGQAQEAYC